METLITVALWAAAGGFALLLFLMFVKRFLYICRPNQVLIFSGGQNVAADGSVSGYRVMYGGRAWRRPFVEEVAELDMRTIPTELVVHNAYSEDGIPLSVRAIANVKIASDKRYIGNAIERFLGRDPAEIHRVARETLEGTLRGVLAQMTPEEVNEDRLKFAKNLSDEVADDFIKLGLHLDVLKVQHVSDEVEYLDSLGRSKIAEVIKRAEIAESNATNEANEESAKCKAGGEIARQQAEQEIVKKRNEQKRFGAEFKAEVESAQRKAKAVGEQARFEAEQELQTIRQTLEQIRLRADVEIPAEAERRAQEFLAKGEAAPIEEDGKALAKALELLATAWAEAGPHARDVYLIQQVEPLMQMVVDKLSALKVKEVHIIDPGDGSALPNYVAGFPATVTSILSELRNSTGIDIPEILGGSNGKSRRASGKAPATV